MFPETQKMGISFSDFVAVYERTDFSEVDKKKLDDMYLWGDDSNIFDKDKSLMQALNIDTEDEALMLNMSQAIPSYAPYFSSEKAKTTKGIDLIKAQIEYVKTAVSAFENSLVSSLTGEEKPEDYKSAIAGLKVAIAGEQAKTQLVSRITEIFKTVLPEKGPVLPSVDQFVQSKEGKELLELLDVLGVRKSTTTIIDQATESIVKKLGKQSLERPMNAADNTELEEITAKNVDLSTSMDYSSDTELSELELMTSNNPFTRLGMFYQLCFQDEQEFLLKVVPGGKNYTDVLSTGSAAESTVALVQGKELDLSGVRPYMEKIDLALEEIIETKWKEKESNQIKAALFTPVMQGLYLSMLNFVLMKALYTFLTKKTTIVDTQNKLKAEEESKNAKVNYTTLDGVAIIIPDFTDPKFKNDEQLRIKTRLAAFEALKKQGFFEKPLDMYSQRAYKRKRSLNPESISLLKIIFASAPELEFTEKLPLKFEQINGVYTPELEKSVKIFQKKAKIASDGIIGPNTRKALLAYEAFNKKNLKTA